jgi:hypothetical protein
MGLAAPAAARAGVVAQVAFHERWRAASRGVPPGPTVNRFANSEPVTGTPFTLLTTGIPWDRVNIDMIGLLSVKTPKGKLKLLAITMIDPATGWFEIHEFDNKKAITIANIVEQEWFSCYPWPTHVSFD